MIMNEAIETLKKAIIADYVLWNSNRDYDENFKADRIAEFTEELIVEEARKYLSLIHI